MLVKGIFQLELLKNRFERNLDSLVKPGNDDFLCVFHEQATQTQDCDTASRSGNPEKGSGFGACPVLDTGVKPENDNIGTKFALNNWVKFKHRLSSKSTEGR